MDRFDALQAFVALGRHPAAHRLRHALVDIAEGEQELPGQEALRYRVLAVREFIERMGIKP